MRKTLVAIIAASTMGVVWADASSQEQYQQQFRDQPQARAYLSYTFGGHSDRKAPAALHYGLRFDHDSRVNNGLNGAAISTLPALFQLDHDNRGETLFSANGVAFAGRNLRLNQGDSSGGSTTTGGGDSGGGWTFFDWTLLAVGVGGAGYLIYDATKGHSSPNPSSGTTTTCTLLVICTTSKGLADTSGSAVNYEQITPVQLNWLDGGTGQMGDLARR